MRNVVMLLLLLNILAFIYQKWIIEPDDSIDAMHIVQEVPGLLQVEKPVKPDQELASEMPVEITEPEYRCLRMGPFALATDADKVRLSLERRDAAVRQSAEPGRVWVGHWVQVADQGSREKAEATRDALVAAGMRDAYILSGADDNRISLGVYRQRSSADRAMQQAASLGFEILINDRYQPGTNFWLRVRLPGDKSFQPGEFQGDTGQILRTESIPCDAAGI